MACLPASETVPDAQFLVPLKHLSADWAFLAVTGCDLGVIGRDLGVIGHD